MRQGMSKTPFVPFGKLCQYNIYSKNFTPGQAPPRAPCAASCHAGPESGGCSNRQLRARTLKLQKRKVQIPHPAKGGIRNDGFQHLLALFRTQEGISLNTGLFWRFSSLFMVI
jgi:hypothetical protein